MNRRASGTTFFVMWLIGGATFGQSEPIAVEAPPYISQGQVMAPARPIFEWLGAKMDQGEASSPQGAEGKCEGVVSALTARYGENVVRLQEGEHHALVNGVQVPIDGRPSMEGSRVESRDGQLFTPLAFLGEALKLQVKWDTAAGGVATLTANEREAALPRFPLIWAGANGRVETMTALLHRGADVNIRTPGGRTALHWAAKQGQIDAAKLLLERGADVNARCKLGWTPLHWAASSGRNAIVELLLARDADISAPDEEGETPLHWAASQGQVETVKLLLDRGANAKARSKAGWTPLHSAAANARKGCTEAVQLLLDRGADVNARDGENKTPLHWAASQGHTEAAKLLLDRAADMTLQCQAGRTPLEWAVSTGRTETAKLLRERMAGDK